MHTNSKAELEVNNYIIIHWSSWAISGSDSLVYCKQKHCCLLNVQILNIMACWGLTYPFHCAATYLCSVSKLADISAKQHITHSTPPYRIVDATIVNHKGIKYLVLIQAMHGEKDYHILWRTHSTCSTQDENTSASSTGPFLESLVCDATWG
jgi:hypothetical protein